MLYIVAYILGIMSVLTIEFLVLIAVAVRRDKHGKDKTVRKQSNNNIN